MCRTAATSPRPGTAPTASSQTATAWTEMNKPITQEQVDAARAQIRMSALITVRDLFQIYRPKMYEALSVGDLGYVRKKIRILRSFIDADIPNTLDFIEAWWEHMVEDDIEVLVGDR